MPKIPNPQVKLLTSQLRILQALKDGACLTKEALCSACGWSPISGTIRSAINGVPPGSSSGPERKGLIALGLVERLDMDIGTETRWQLTSKGEDYWIRYGSELPPPRDRELSTNQRYKK